VSEALERGRSAFAGQAWAEAYERLSAADRAAPLEPDDLERLATAAYLVGLEDDSAELWARAHHQLLARGDAERAARCAVWLAFGLLNRGELARGGGWVARARRVLADGRQDLAEHGYLLWLAALVSIMEGRTRDALDGFERAAALGDRWGEPDLAALARLGVGRALIRLGEHGPGVALLDEVMVAVEAGELSPIVVGDLYCTVIEGCQELFDLRRAQQWTAVLTAWCQTQPDLVPYRGQCLLHRAELLQLHGAWPDAMAEARQAYARLLEPTGHPAAGAAAYQEGELHRLRGEAAEAEEAYRRASRLGREPQPGLALLRLAQGKVAAAQTAVRRVLEAATDRHDRCRLLPAGVEIALAAGDLAAAEEAAAELEAAAEELDAPLLRAAGGRPRRRPAGPRRRPVRPGRVARRRRGLAGAGGAVRGGAGPRGHRAGLPGPRRPGLGGHGAGRRPLGLPAARRRHRPGPGGGGGRRRHRRGRRPDRAGGPGAAAGRHRPDQPGHRGRAGAERAHGGPAREQHLHQARRALARRRHRLGLPAPPPLNLRPGPGG
jgi:tetratricopeptide (TPR) repeat protein